MFDRRNPQAPATPAPRPMPQTPMEGRERSASATTQLLSIVGPDARIEGRFDISDSIQIECEVGGELRVGGRLVIGAQGIVRAEVHTVDAVIMGHFEGLLVASGNVEITETGRVSGNIQTDSLVISKGGSFDGNVLKIAGAPSAQTLSLGDRRRAQPPSVPSIGRYEPPSMQDEEESYEDADNNSVTTPLSSSSDTLSMPDMNGSSFDNRNKLQQNRHQQQRSNNDRNRNAGSDNRNGRDFRQTFPTPPSSETAGAD